MPIMFKSKYGFFDNNNNKYVGYLYEEIDSGRQFAVSKKTNDNGPYYINELDESFLATDNTYSTLISYDLIEAKEIISGLVDQNTRI